MQKVLTRRVPLSRPSVTQIEKDRVAAVLDRGRLAMGPETAAFEEAMSDICGTTFAVAVNSGTSALHLIVRALGLGPGDEVITTPYSFVASANALLFEGITPIFVDVEPESYNIDLDALEQAVTPGTRAVLAVDVFGMPVDWPRLEAIARFHDLELIDDACEGLGAAVDGKQLGSWGAAAAFGFYPNKQITTGEGGCITTDDAEIAAVCRSMRNQGRADDRFMEHVRLGYNYRMDEMSAALGCAQLSRWEELATQRRLAAEQYSSLLFPLFDFLRSPCNPSSVTRSWFVYVVELADRFRREDRDNVIQKLDAFGIECAPYFPTIHLQPYYSERFGYRQGAFPVAEHASDRTIALPLYAEIEPDDIEYVVAHLGKVLRDL
jgi:perosamine synthetase